MQERQEFLDHYFVFSDQTDYQPPKDYSRTNGLLEEIRQSLAEIEEKKRLEELKAPSEIKTHLPGNPLELPAPINPAGAAPTAPRTAPAPGPAAPVPRS